MELAGLNHNVHEQNHSREEKHLRSLHNMTFAYCTYTIRMINEIQNERHTYRTLRNLPASMSGHPHDMEVSYETLL